MPRYFFNTANGSPDRDIQGFVLPDRAAARFEATRYAGALINDEPEKLWENRDFRVEVTDDTGHLLFTVITLAIDAAPSYANDT